MATCAKYSAKSCGLVDDEAIKSKAEDDLSHLNKFCPSGKSIAQMDGHNAKLG